MLETFMNGIDQIGQIEIQNSKEQSGEKFHMKKLMNGVVYGT